MSDLPYHFLTFLTVAITDPQRSKDIFPLITLDTLKGAS